MPKIILIGNSALRNDYEDALVSAGYSVNKFNSS